MTAIPARADVLAIPGERIVVPTSEVPAKGSSMASVEKLYGPPRVRHAAAGGDTPRHPPITRWDYETFSVFFEHHHVVDSVRPDAPAAIGRRDELSAAH